MRVFVSTARSPHRHDRTEAYQLLHERAKLLADYHFKHDQSGAAQLSQSVYDALSEFSKQPVAYDDPDERMSVCNHYFVEGVDEDGQLVEPPFDQCIHCGEKRY